MPEAEATCSRHPVLPQEHEVSDILGIGIGIPGAIRRDGAVNKCVNLGWGVVYVADELSITSSAFPSKIPHLMDVPPMSIPNIVLLIVITATHKIFLHSSI